MASSRHVDPLARHPSALSAFALVGGLVAALGTAAAAPAAGSAACQAASAERAPTVVELYTSEGCNSCPPADRWLSTLKGRRDVVAAAFHVDYWDRLGWKDRFGDPRHTARQAEGVRQSGARFAYTPQVLVNGRDWRQWPDLPDASRAAPARVQLRLQRESAERVQVQVQALDSAPARLGLWWALLEDGHVSAVKAGENQGVTLHHDHVVRAQGQRAAWAATDAAPWSLAAPAMGEGGRAARLLVVVTDAATGQPLQAVQLGC